jgi:hypothetical protein
MSDRNRFLKAAVLTAVVLVWGLSIAPFGPALAAGGGSKSTRSFLGDDPKPSILDQDIFEFTGIKGERVTVTLEPDSLGSHTGKQANLSLFDGIKRTRFFKTITGALPRTITGVLPNTGRYLILVEELPGFARLNSFRGDYRLTLESSAGAYAALTPTAWVEQMANTAPVVNAGLDVTVKLPDGAPLHGTASDDGLPGPLATTWSVINGPGTVTFDNSYSVDTAAHFSQSGTYILRLTANDGALSASDDLTVVVEAGGPLTAPPDTPIRDAISEIFIQYPVSDTEISVDEFGREIIRSQLKIIFRSTSTAGEANNLLNSIGAVITGSIAGTRALVVRIPDPGSLAALDTLIAQIEANPSVWFVRKGVIPKLDALPSNIAPTSISDLSKVDHHLAVKAHAAWNAKAAATNTPNVVVVDHFGSGAPSPTYLSYIPVDLSDFVSNALFGGSDHGYHVLGIISGSFDGDSTDRGLVTGMYPGPVRLRVGDKAESRSSFLDTEMLVLNRAASLSGNVVISTSLGDPCPGSGPLCRTDEESNRSAVDWIEAVRAAGLEARTVHLTSAGNIDVATMAPPNAPYNSSFASAAVLPDLIDEFNFTVPNLTNTLAIENARTTGDHSATAPPTTPYGVECLSISSYTGGSLSAIGTNVWSLTAAGADYLTGTSMATPQVAGLAAYLWSIDPSLTPQQLITILTATANPVPLTFGAGCSTWHAPAPSIDAYAAVLALDKAASNPNLAKVRLAVLDVADAVGSEGTNNAFDAYDLDLWLSKIAGIAQPALDYSRFDLNGDGFTGGSTTARFDLDINDPPAWTTVSRTIGSNSVSFNESALTDLQTLCYYAYSPLYTGDPASRDQKMAGRCLGGPSPVTYSLDYENIISTDVYNKLHQTANLIVAFTVDATGIPVFTVTGSMQETDDHWYYSCIESANLVTQASQVTSAYFGSNSYGATGSFMIVEFSGTRSGTGSCRPVNDQVTSSVQVPYREVRDGSGKLVALDFNLSLPAFPTRPSPPYGTQVGTGYVWATQ